MTFVFNLAAAVDGIIKFDIPLNIKFQRSSATKLKDELYNYVPHDLFNFLESLNDRSTKIQWSNNVGIMMIPKDLSDVNTDYVKLLTNNGEINLDMIKNVEETYIGKESRAAQDTNMLYRCLMDFLSKVGKAKVSVWNSQYTFNRLP